MSGPAAPRARVRAGEVRLAAAPPVRVLADPGFAPGNLYTTQLYRHLQAEGAEVDEFTPGRALSGAWDVWHLHWPEAPLNARLAPRAWAASLRLLAVLDGARRRGVSILWTVHNLSAHEGLRPRFEAWFWKAFVRRVDGWIALTEAGRDAARAAFPELADRPGWVVPHGHYRGAYPATLTREAARARLGIAPGARVLAFVGQIRPYKNVPALVDAARALHGVEVLVAGRPRTRALERWLRGEAERGAIRLYPGFVPDDELQLYLKAADLVVLPFREILNSGSALLALSFDRPVLVPRRGAMGELQETVGGEWVRTYEGELTPELLAEALEWAGADRGAAPLQALDWAPLARRTLAAYRALAERHNGGTTDAGA